MLGKVLRRQRSVKPTPCHAISLNKQRSTFSKVGLHLVAVSLMCLYFIRDQESIDVLRGAGLVCDRGLTLGNLIGLLREFFKRMGMPHLRFKPAYNPYTEPSMEIFG